jgi:hypothetical protein
MSGGRGGHEGERKAKGGAPLMRGAHNTCQGSNVWQRRRGGVRNEGGREF